MESLLSEKTANEVNAVHSSESTDTETYSSAEENDDDYGDDDNDDSYYSFSELNLGNYGKNLDAFLESLVETMRNTGPVDEKPDLSFSPWTACVERQISEQQVFSSDPNACNSRANELKLRTLFKSTSVLANSSDIEDERNEVDERAKTVKTKSNSAKRLVLSHTIPYESNSMEWKKPSTMQVRYTTHKISNYGARHEQNMRALPKPTSAFYERIMSQTDPEQQIDRIYLHQAATKKTQPLKKLRKNDKKGNYENVRKIAAGRLNARTTDTKTKKYTCSICNAKFILRSLYQAHKLQHAEEAQAMAIKLRSRGCADTHQCIYCDKKFVIERSLQLHQLQYCNKIPTTERRIMKIKDCDAYLQLTSKCHTTVYCAGSADSPTFRCKGGADKSWDDLNHNKNLNFFHRKGSPQKQLPTPLYSAAVKKSIPCFLCGISFKSSSDYTEHTLTKHCKHKTAMRRAMEKKHATAAAAYAEEVRLREQFKTKFEQRKCKWSKAARDEAEGQQQLLQERQHKILAFKQKVLEYKKQKRQQEQMLKVEQRRAAAIEQEKKKKSMLKNRKETARLNERHAKLLQQQPKSKSVSLAAQLVRVREDVRR